MSATTYAVLIIAIEAVTLLGAWRFLWVYMWDNAWWRTEVGKALVILAVCVNVIILFSVFRRVFDWGQWSSIVQLGSVAVAVWYLALVFGRVRRVQRRLELAKKDHRIERTES